MQNLKKLTFCVLFSTRFFTICLNFKAHSINFNIYIVTSIAQDAQAESRRKIINIPKVHKSTHFT